MTGYYDDDHVVIITLLHSENLTLQNFKWTLVNVSTVYIILIFAGSLFIQH